MADEDDLLEADADADADAEDADDDGCGVTREESAVGPPVPVTAVRSPSPDAAEAAADAVEVAADAAAVSLLPLMLLMVDDAVRSASATPDGDEYCVGLLIMSAVLLLCLFSCLFLFPSDLNFVHSTRPFLKKIYNGNVSLRCICATSVPRKESAASCVLCVLDLLVKGRSLYVCVSRWMTRPFFRTPILEAYSAFECTSSYTEPLDKKSRLH
mmetsp:Transcript_9974/g.21561  ORF Transcript_9974/g.21561 Transcript_9974/m.21561 type:complete len:213 (-) Transcript_9974:106-744(-)